jgi:heptosyltransferase-2
LLIQTAFLGDVILATALIEKLKDRYPAAQIDFLVRKGNEGILLNHPKLREVVVFDKKNKVRELWRVIQRNRAARYDYIINVQRFATTGLITTLSRAAVTIGFDKNPLSRLFSVRAKHETTGLHEVERNQRLIAALTDQRAARPRLYPSEADRQAIAPFTEQPFVVIAPASIWFTKQWPAHKWVQLCARWLPTHRVYLLGAPADHGLCEAIAAHHANLNIVNLAGRLTLLQSAALMKQSVMNYVNDSAPMHLASAMDAPVTAVYCSTVPSFGFGPLSSKQKIVETTEVLDCRPCGLHGHKECPQRHFRCAESISVEAVV